MTEQEIIDFTKTVTQNVSYVKSCIDLLPDKLKNVTFLKGIFASGADPLSVISSLANLNAFQPNLHSQQIELYLLNYKKKRGIL